MADEPCWLCIFTLFSFFCISFLFHPPPSLPPGFPFLLHLLFLLILFFLHSSNVLFSCFLFTALTQRITCSFIYYGYNSDSSLTSQLLQQHFFPASLNSFTFLPCSSPLKQLFSHTHARTHKLSIHTLVHTHTHTSIVSLQGSTSILSEHEYLIGLPSKFTQFIMLYWAVSDNQYASLHQSYITICASTRVVM